MAGFVEFIRDQIFDYEGKKLRKELIEAASKGDTASVKNILGLRRDATPNQIELDQPYYLEALRAAAKEGHVEIVRIFLNFPIVYELALKSDLGRIAQEYKSPPQKHKASALLTRSPLYFTFILKLSMRKWECQGSPYYVIAPFTNGPLLTKIKTALNSDYYKENPQQCYEALQLALSLGVDLKIVKMLRDMPGVRTLELRYFLKKLVFAGLLIGLAFGSKLALASADLTSIYLLGITAGLFFIPIAFERAIDAFWGGVIACCKKLFFPKKVSENTLKLSIREWICLGVSRGLVRAFINEPVLARIKEALDSDYYKKNPQQCYETLQLALSLGVDLKVVKMLRAMPGVRALEATPSLKTLTGLYVIGELFFHRALLTGVGLGPLSFAIAHFSTVGAAIGYVLQKVLRQGLDWYFNNAIAHAKKQLPRETVTEEERATISWAHLAGESCPDLYVKSYLPVGSQGLGSDVPVDKCVKMFVTLWKEFRLARGVMEMTQRGDPDLQALRDKPSM